MGIDVKKLRESRSQITVPAPLAMATPKVFFPPSPASLAPRIHRRLAQYIRHRYRRYEPGGLLSTAPVAAAAPATAVTPSWRLATGQTILLI